MDEITELVGTLGNVAPTIDGAEIGSATVAQLPIPTSIDEVTATMHTLADMWTEFALSLEHDAAQQSGPMGMILAATSAGAVGVLRSVVIPTLTNLAASIDRRLAEEADAASAAWERTVVDLPPRGETFSVEAVDEFETSADETSRLAGWGEPDETEDDAAAPEVRS